MLSFRQFYETSFNPAHLSVNLRDNPDSRLWRGAGAILGAGPAALSGVVPAAFGMVGALKGAKSRAYNAAYQILNYLHANPKLEKEVLAKLHQVIGRVESGGKMGVIGGGNLPSVNTAGYNTLGAMGGAMWKGMMVSAKNLMDTIFGGVGGDGFVKFKEFFRQFFEALGSMSRERALPLLKNFEHVLLLGGLGDELDRDIWV